MVSKIKNKHEEWERQETTHDVPTHETPCIFACCSEFPRSVMVSEQDLSESVQNNGVIEQLCKKIASLADFWQFELDIVVQGKWGLNEVSRITNKFRMTN
jgi:hypothetical protein